MNRSPIPETPAGYLARAKAVYKISLGAEPCRNACCGGYATLGEFLHRADVAGV